jgi:hypothetical protein
LNSGTDGLGIDASTKSTVIRLDASKSAMSSKIAGLLMLVPLQ